MSQAGTPKLHVECYVGSGNDIARVLMMLWGRHFKPLKYLVCVVELVAIGTQKIHRFTNSASQLASIIIINNQPLHSSLVGKIISRTLFPTEGLNI